MRVTLKDRVAELVQQHGSLKKASEALGLSPGYLCRLRKGEQNTINADTAKRLGIIQAEVVYERVNQ